MTKFLRGTGWFVGVLLGLVGLFVLVNDSLVIAHVVQPTGEGPYGVVVGPVLILMGVVLMLWLRNTSSTYN
jgi:hypothetical protein